MKKSAFAVLGLIIAAFFAGTALAGPQDFTLVNLSLIHISEPKRPY